MTHTATRSETHSTTRFPVHTLDSAPAKARPLLSGLEQSLGMIPNLAAAMAESPGLLEGFFVLRKIFYSGSFSPAEVQLIALANAYENSCRYCMTLHTAVALQEGAAEASVEALRRGVPLRERNALLLAAGYAPCYTESHLEGPAAAPEMAEVRRALAAILERQEPYPAVVMNRRWDLVDANAAAGRFFGFLLGGGGEEGDAGEGGGESVNVLRMMFDPTGLRPHVANWEEIGEALLRRVGREAVGGVADAATRGLVDELLAYPGVPERWRRPAFDVPLVPVLPVRFEKAGRRFDFFSTVTVLGTPQDVTLQELRVECFFPNDDETRANAERLARTG